MSKVLIACYSRSGYTASLAREIADMTGWDLEEIKDRRPRDGNWGFARCIRDVLLHLQPAIITGGKQPEDYDLVVLMAPVWMRRLAAPMRSYIARNRSGLKQVAFACTYGGNGAEWAAAQAAAIAHKPLKASFAVTSQELEQADYRRRLDEFLKNVKAA